MARITDDYVGTLVWRILSSFTRLQSAHRLMEANTSVRAADLRLIWLMADGEPRSVKEIADELALERSTVSRQVNAALVDGFVERAEHPVAGARPFVVTQHGVGTLTQILERNLDLYEGALATVPEGERERFVELLSGVVDAYGTLAAEHHGVRAD